MMQFLKTFLFQAIQLGQTVLTQTSWCNGIVVREFVLQSRYYVHFRANTIGKGMNPLSSQLWVK